MEIKIEITKADDRRVSPFSMHRNVTFPVASEGQKNGNSNSLPCSRTKPRSNGSRSSRSSTNNSNRSEISSPIPIQSTVSSISDKEDPISPIKTLVTCDPKPKPLDTLAEKRKLQLKKIYENDEIYEARKKRLLEKSKIKKDLERYFGVITPNQLAEKNKPQSDDEEYDTDLDTDLVGIELIVDEKTRQMKDDGLFPEYKQSCRKLSVVPNSYFIRHSVDDDLVMKYRYLNAGDCVSMSTEMKNSLTFKKLDLDDNGIGPKQIRSMARMLMKNNTVVEINLSNNPMGPSGARALRSIFLNNAYISKANLTGCNFGENGGAPLADIVENNVYLKELYLGHNKLGDSAVRLIGKALEKNVTLEVLDIRWNGFGKPGAYGISNGIRVNTQLRCLNLSMNGLCADGCLVIISGLRINDGIEEVDLSWNRITDEAAEALGRFASHSRSVKKLKLSHNLFTSDGAYTILRSLQSKLKKTVRHVELDGIDAYSDLLELAQLLRSKYKLTISLEQPSSRRERATDILTKALISLVNFMDEETLTLKMLYPSLDYDKEEFISTEDVIEKIKDLDVISRFRLHEIKRILRPTRYRCFQLKELALVEQLQKEGKDATLYEPLRTPLAGRRRGRMIASSMPTKPASKSGVRFVSSEDDDD